MDTQLEQKQQLELIIEQPLAQAHCLWTSWWATQTHREQVIVTPLASPSLPD